MRLGGSLSKIGDGGVREKIRSEKGHTQKKTEKNRFRIPN